MIDLFSFIHSNAVPFIVFLSVALFLLMIKLIELCFIFKKTDTMPILGFIPFYNLYKLCTIVWKKSIFCYMIISLIFSCLIFVPMPVCTIVGSIYITIFVILLFTLRVKTSLAFSPSTTKAIFMAITPCVIGLNIAFSHSTYRGPQVYQKTFTNWFAKLCRYFSLYEKCWMMCIATLAIILGVVFSGPENAIWLTIIEIITVLGGCSCELLLSKQSRWAHIVSFLFYDSTQTIIYFANGFYISALFEILFWAPILFISFVVWSRHKDNKEGYLTQVKAINIKRDLVIFIVILTVSIGVGVLFTQIGSIAEGLSDWWYLDALANTFSVCNGLFILLRFREQWVPWIGVAIVEGTMWILSGQYALLVLSAGYLMNSIYGFIRWSRYAKNNPVEDKPSPKNANINTGT
ncbi:MAG: nicotinamide mononucleotide transporter [Clostridia bacterium]|nr:nicotinamide mononucleotide transporter [Clostridia bacterium]